MKKWSSHLHNILVIAQIAQLLLHPPPTVLVSATVDTSKLAYIPFSKLGIADPNSCKYDASGWLFAAQCKDTQDYDRDFFQRNGYQLVPRDDQVYLTDLWFPMAGQGKQMFIYVHDGKGYAKTDELCLSKVFYEAGAGYEHAEQSLYVRYND